MKASTILIKARKLLNSTGHTKGVLARNKYRHKVDPTSPSAVKFCAYGALRKVLDLKNGERNIQDELVTKYLYRTVPNYTWGVARYNDADSTTPEDVENWFNRAIGLALSEGD